MIDRDKVIKGVECCSGLGGECSYCPYGKYHHSVCDNRLVHDVIELLKADQAELISQREHIESLEGLVDQLEGR